MINTECNKIKTNQNVTENSNTSFLDTSDYLELETFLKDSIKDLRKSKNGKIPYYSEARKHIAYSSEKANYTYNCIEELAVNVINSIVSCNPTVKNNLQLINLMGCLNPIIELILNSKDGVGKMDRKVLEEIRDMLAEALENPDPQARHEKTTNTLNFVNQQLAADTPSSLSETPVASWVEKVSGVYVPHQCPLKWAEADNFTLSNVKDDLLKRKLEEHPEMIEEIRDAKKSKDVVRFYRLVWQDYVEAGTLQADIKKLDRTFIEVLKTEQKNSGSTVGNLIKKKSQKTDEMINILIEQGFTIDDISRFGNALKKRHERCLL